MTKLTLKLSYSFKLSFAFVILLSDKLFLSLKASPPLSEHEHEHESEVEGEAHAHSVGGHSKSNSHIQQRTRSGSHTGRGSHVGGLTGWSSDPAAYDEMVVPAVTSVREFAPPARVSRNNPHMMVYPRYYHTPRICQTPT